MKSLTSALPWLKAIPAGGIKSNLNFFEEWFKAGAEAITIGSDLFGKYKLGDDLQSLKKDLSLILDAIERIKEWIACPKDYEPNSLVLKKTYELYKNKNLLKIINYLELTVLGGNVFYKDVWSSRGKKLKK